MDEQRTDESFLDENSEDEALILQAQSGDSQAMERLIRRHSDLVKSCARGFFLLGGETEDLIQEGMIGLYSGIMRYERREGGCSFKSFARLCITRQIIDAVKAAARKKNAPLNNGVSVSEVDGWLLRSTFNPEELLIIGDETRELQQKLLMHLSDFEYRVVSMYIESRTTAEICAATGKSEKSVRNAIQRSKRKLQEVWKE